MNNKKLSIIQEEIIDEITKQTFKMSYDVT